MNNVESALRSKFFPTTKSGARSSREVEKSSFKRNDLQRKKELESTTGNDAKVNIPEATRDFARIKNAVDLTPDLDNSEKVTKLKSQIQNGTYRPDYDALADKVISQEFK